MSVRAGRCICPRNLKKDEARYHSPAPVRVPGGKHADYFPHLKTREFKHGSLEMTAPGRARARGGTGRARGVPSQIGTRTWTPPKRCRSSRGQPNAGAPPKPRSPPCCGLVITARAGRAHLALVSNGSIVPVPRTPNGLVGDHHLGPCFVDQHHLVL